MSRSRFAITTRPTRRIHAVSDICLTPRVGFTLELARGRTGIESYHTAVYLPARRLPCYPLHYKPRYVVTGFNTRVSKGGANTLTHPVLGETLARVSAESTELNLSTNASIFCPCYECNRLDARRDDLRSRGCKPHILPLYYTPHN